MKFDISKLWKIGKPILKGVARNASVKYVNDICMKYQVGQDRASRLANNTGHLIDLSLNMSKGKHKELLDFLKGDFADSLLSAIYTANDSKNMVADLLDAASKNNLGLVLSALEEFGDGAIRDNAKELRHRIELIQNGEECMPAEKDAPIQYDSDDKINGITVTNYRNDFNLDDDNQFITDLSKSFVPAKVDKGTAALELLNTFVDKTNETVRFIEEQETKRTVIRNVAKVRIAEINAMRDCFKTYLDKTFDERRYLFQREFDALDKALEKGNVESVAFILDNITDLAKSSPFKNLSDFNYVQKQLSQKGTVFDI